MPGKGRRVASRQAELGRRRRRQHRTTGGVGAEGAGPETAVRSSIATEERQPAPESTESSTPPQPRPSAPPQPQRTLSRSRLDRPAAYNYVMPEIRRIAIMGGVLLAALIGVSVALPYVI